MRAFSLLPPRSLFIFPFILFAVCGDIGGLGDQTASYGAIGVSNHADWGCVDSAENVLIFNNYFDKYAVVARFSELLSFLAYGGTKVRSAPEKLGWADIRIVSADTSVNTDEMATQDADIFKHFDVEGCPLANIPNSIIPAVLHVFISRTITDWRHFWRNGNTSQNWSLIKLEFRPLFSQFGLRSAQLLVENPGGDPRQHGGNDRSDARNHCPASDAPRDLVLFILFCSAFFCGLCAFYCATKWPGSGAAPLVVLVLVALGCVIQLDKLSLTNGSTVSYQHPLIAVPNMSALSRLLYRN
jgi:hypothetical protein